MKSPEKSIFKVRLLTLYFASEFYPKTPTLYVLNIRMKPFLVIFL